MRTSLATVAAALVCAASFQPRPASAAYCGPSADTAAIERRTVQSFGKVPKPGQARIDRSNIMAVAVSGDYAESFVEFAGQRTMFFRRTGGQWRYAGDFIPAAWPSNVKKKLTAIGDERSNGSTQCGNPHFTSRGSG
jgi:hypothetical protein